MIFKIILLYFWFYELENIEIKKNDKEHLSLSV